MHENDRRALPSSNGTDQRAGESNVAIREVDVRTFLDLDAFAEARSHPRAARSGGDLPRALKLDSGFNGCRNREARARDEVVRSFG
jgi:hypothetical protein